MSKQTVSVDFHGREFSIETGRFAKFASGSAMVRCGDTMVLVTAVASEKESPDIDYLPLQVEYREKMSSGGKIPGGFLKRETRPSDHEVLASRLIDRPIRPLMPELWRYETQIIATVYSFDPEVDQAVLGAVGASAALLLSDIPFGGPISEVRIGRIDGKLVINPSKELLKISDIDLTVSGTSTSINMVEGECKEISEEEFLAALEFAHENIKVLNNLQLELQKLAGKEKREFTENKAPAELFEYIKEFITGDIIEYIHQVTTKKERSKTRKELREKTVTKAKEEFAEKEGYEGFKFEKEIDTILDNIEKYEMRRMILEESKRLDGRKLNEVRPITIELDVLPRTHGSALFTRGETQSLTSITLGTKNDQQMIDGLLPTYTNNFMLHYNFPPFSTGEVKRIGLGRREIGHGNLAERALKNMLPPEVEFPYTARVVSDILESNGSSSMATVCAGSLALFNAGVPMLKAVSGIAMGLIMEGDKIAILSDILGDEDHLGDMDFKVTGTKDGITACQMDIKIEGITIDVMRKALYQAQEGRHHILGKMNEVISEPNPEMSPYAPRFTILKVPVESIGAIIGPGGEMIRSIVAKTGTDINIEDDGTVTIAATSGEASEMAVNIINAIIRKPEIGDLFDGTILEIRDGLGLMIEFMPKKKGLCHLSQIPPDENGRGIWDVYKQGESVKVRLVGVTREGKYDLSIKATASDDPATYTRERRSSGGGDRDRGPRSGGGGRPPYNRDRDSRDSRDSRPPRRDYDRDRRDDRGPDRDRGPRRDYDHGGERRENRDNNGNTNDNPGNNANNE